MIPFSTKQISVTNFIFITFSIGFFGGVLGFFFIQYCFSLFSRALPLPSDAIAIANTYIVFTTFIFTWLAIFLALATYYFSIQQSKSRKYLENELLEKILMQCQEDKDIGIKVIIHLIKNQEAINRFEEFHSEKIRDIVNSYMAQYLYTVESDQCNTVPLTARIANVKGKVKRVSGDIEGESSSDLTKVSQSQRPLDRIWNLLKPKNSGQE